MDRFTMAANEIAEKSSPGTSQSSQIASLFQSFYGMPIESDSCHDCRRFHERQQECKCDCHNELFTTFGDKPIRPVTPPYNNGTGLFQPPVEVDDKFVDTYDKLIIAHPPMPNLLSPRDRSQFVCDVHKPAWQGRFVIPLDQVLSSRIQSRQSTSIQETSEEESSWSRYRRYCRQHPSGSRYGFVDYSSL